MSNKFCPSCGAKLTNESFKFCPECGFNLHSDENRKKEDNFPKNHTNKILTPLLNPIANRTAKSIINQMEKQIPDDNLSKDPKIRQEQLELLKKYGSGGTTTPVIDTTGMSAFQKGFIKGALGNKVIMDSSKESKVKNSNEPFSFRCVLREQRIGRLGNLRTDSFSGKCTMTNHSLVIKGQKNEKIISFSNITAVNSKKSLFSGEVRLTLTGGNKITLHSIPKGDFDILLEKLNKRYIKI